VGPSAFALGRLRELGAPLDGRARAIASVQREFATRSRAAGGEHALVAARLSPEKGVDLAIRACRRAGVRLVVAGDGPQAGELRALAAGADVRFTGHVSPAELSELRARAAVAIVPSRYQEILPLAAAEAMAAGLPTVATRMGGLVGFVPAPELVEPENELELAARVAARFGDEEAGERALAAAREHTSPAVVGAALREVYDG
jgi:glycosyltransferase involved in cell wall biosynthesis